MRDFKSLAQRLVDQSQSRAALAERVRKIRARQTGISRNQPKLKAEESPSSQPPTEQSMQHAQNQVRAGSAKIKLQVRATNETTTPQPWTIDLVNTVLKAVEQRCITLCLVWPSKLTSLPLFHAMANLERQFAKDLRGFRTLFYPATHACRGSLHGILVDKIQLSNLYRSLWKVYDGSTIELSSTSSEAFTAALGAVNDIRIQHPELPNPSLAELVPTFVFDPVQQEWTTPVTSPLERTLSKVERLANRRILREKVSTEWGIPNKAPAALMALHHSAKKRGWRNALKSSALKSPGQPEILLFDATDAAAKTNYSAVKRIPDYLLFARENGLSDSGAVIVTDDPATFFNFRKQLYESKLDFTTKVRVAEADDVLFSAYPVASNWTPAQRSNSNFSVKIVDRDASQLALKFQSLMASAGDEDTPAHKALLQAFLYVLRLSNMPAGYTDLTSSGSDAEDDDNYNHTRNAWTPIKLALNATLASGVLNEVREAVEHAIQRADKLIDDWNDATPIAARLLAEIKKRRRSNNKGISLVLPNDRYISFARRFLQRKFGGDWPIVEPDIEWHTLPAVAKTLTCDSTSKHFVFLGVNPNVVRVLLTHPRMPHGTAVLVAYRQAESTLKTLKYMKEVDEFKAYKGRIGLLAQELERRLAEVPNPIAINKLREMPMTFQFEEKGCQNDDSEYYTFELESGNRTYAAGWVYRYVPEEDPVFRRAAASAIQPGDFIFEMSDELRNKLELSLHLNDEGISSVVNPVRMLLKLYHDDVQRRCELLFKSSKRSSLAREIYARMVELDPQAAECRPGRVYYWLALSTKNDSRPHASRDSKYFKIFCKALGISDDTAEQHWSFIQNARRLNQSLGRELVARYAEILFQPESASIYRKVSEDVLLELRQDALSCVFRVEGIKPPSTRMAKSKKESKSAYS
ncbi:hypothetical protein [Alkalimonas sp.]|uniref:hypothetical protein n=1 Tax=Alkalimonas sp. TaxID=1872453 RepID=UPI00263B7C34|nr:hypothetical protein [Alkalimonas sp.]MCC5827051.1 hypothetical protein [Alkalimonas sp.]